MPAHIPNADSVGHMPVGGKRRRFVGAPPSAQSGVLTGARQSRIGFNGNRMLSVIRRIGGNTSARDAQAEVVNTTHPGSRLKV